jgi:hypothetical protein
VSSRPKSKVKKTSNVKIPRYMMWEKSKEWLGLEKFHVKIARARQLKRDKQRLKGWMERMHRLSLYRWNKRIIRKLPKEVPQAPTCAIARERLQEPIEVNAIPRPFENSTGAGSEITAGAEKGREAEHALGPVIQALYPGPTGTDDALKCELVTVKGESVPEVPLEHHEQVITHANTLRNCMYEQRGGGPKQTSSCKKGKDR